MPRTSVWVLAVFAAAGGGARADEPAAAAANGDVVPASGVFHRRHAAPVCPPGYPAYPDCPPATPGMPGVPGVPGMPIDPTMPPAVPPPDLGGLTTPFATQTGAGGLQGRAFNESFDGDFGGTYYRKTVVVGTRTVRQQVGTRQQVIIIPPPRPGLPPTQVVVTVPVFGNVTVPATQALLVPVPGRYSGISITDNDSPRPTDRLYFNYFYYDGIGRGLSPSLGNVTLNRPTLGFEKTFLGGDASIGMRLPFIQLNGPPGVGADAVGDLSVLTKYAFVNSPNGNVAAAGLILTTPTGGGGGFLSDGTEVPHSLLFQPWLGFVTVFDRAYVQGITAVVVPTDRRDTTLMANSLGIGYWLYRADGDRLITGVIPVVEVHVRTPFNNRDINGLVYLQDQVNLTGGLHVRLPRATIGGAVCVPVMGPRPWNIEAIANCSFRF